MPDSQSFLGVAYARPGEDAPAAVPPGYTGYAAPFATTGAPTAMVASNAPAMRSVLAGIVNGASGAGRDIVDGARDAGALTRGFLDGSLDTRTPGAVERGFGAAGLAMTGSMPFKAPAGALRSGAAAVAREDPLAALGAALANHGEPAQSWAAPVSRVDPTAKSWDLYHGTGAPEDFARFRTDLPAEMRPSTPASEGGGVYLSPAADEAAVYANRGGDGTGAGPRIIRTTVEPGRTDVFDLPYLMENDPAFVARARQIVIDDAGGREAAGRMFDERRARMLEEFRSNRDLNAQLAEMGYPPTPATVPWGEGGAGAAMQTARERGLDTAVLRGLGESNGGDQVVVLTPGRVRSHYAPDQILFSGGPAAAAVGLPVLADPSAPRSSSIADALAGYGFAPAR